MRDMTTRRSPSIFLVTVLAGAVATAIVLDGVWSHAAAARPAQWTVVVSEKTGGADGLSEYGTNSQYYLIWAVLMKRAGGTVNEALVRQAYEFLRRVEHRLRGGLGAGNAVLRTVDGSGRSDSGFVGQHYGKNHHVKFFAQDRPISGEQPTCMPAWILGALFGRFAI
jgi:hypothetical protein